jgi:hypothetical protein
MTGGGGGAVDGGFGGTRVSCVGAVFERDLLTDGPATTSDTGILADMFVAVDTDTVLPVRELLSDRGAERDVRE